MDHKRQVKIETTLTEHERTLVSSVLNKYNFEVNTIYKARSAYKIGTSEGNICLKRMKHGKYKAKNGYLLVEALLEHGFDNTAQYLKTREGKFYVELKNNIFYATEWIDGEECNLNEMTELIHCTKLLAEFHKATQKINVRKLAIRNNLKNWPKIFTSNLQDLEKFKKSIEKKKIKNEFDISYSGCIDSFYNRGMIALQFLNNSQYYKMSKSASEEKTICHDSFYYQNIIKKETKYYIIDLDSIIIDLQIIDLGKFIRRLMYKKEYNWQFSCAKSLIEAYSSINPLSKKELEVMAALLLFPHKFWKLGKKRYLKHKNWKEAKYSHKLNKLVAANDLQEKFLTEYIQYIDTLSYEEEEI